MHSASFFTTLIATRLPGIEGIYLSQDIRFIRPVRTATRSPRRPPDHTEDNRDKPAIGEMVIDGNAVSAVMR
jgi:hypothetical protein